MTSHALLPDGKGLLVVWSLLELESAAEFHVLLELNWVSSAQILERSLTLLLLDIVVFLILGSAWESLPWQLALEQVEQDVANALQVVTSRLLNSFMGGDGGISGGSSQVFSVLVGDVHALSVLVALSKTKVNDVDVVASGVGSTNEEVVWLDITMDESLFVHLLDTAHKLDGDQKHSL